MTVAFFSVFWLRHLLCIFVAFLFNSTSFHNELWFQTVKWCVQPNIKYRHLYLYHFNLFTHSYTLHDSKCESGTLAQFMRWLTFILILRYKITSSFLKHDFMYLICYFDVVLMIVVVHTVEYDELMNGWTYVSLFVSNYSHSNVHGIMIATACNASHIHITRAITTVRNYLLATRRRRRRRCCRCVF